MTFHRFDGRRRTVAGTVSGRDRRRHKKGAGSAPPTPDPAALAAAQGAANKEAVLESAKVSQINEITPFGTSRYVGAIGDPSRTRITELPRDQQALVDLQRRLGLTLGGPAMSRALEIGGQGGFNLEGIRELPGSEDLLAAAQPVEEATFGRIMGLARPQLERARHDLVNDLTVRGLPAGDEAWNRAMGEFGERERETDLAAAQEAVRAGRAEQSRLFGLTQAERQQGISDRLLERTQPINEISAYMQGTPAMPLPNFGATANYGVAPPDIISAYGLQQSAGQANANRQASSQQGVLGALAGLGGAAIWASDRRGKNVGPKVKPAEATEALSEMPVHAWRYKGGGPTRVGPMAQDMAAAGYGDGTTIEPITAFGLSTAAIADLNGRMKRLEHGRARR